MAKFTINMTCDNAAFDPPEFEVSRILRVIAGRIDKRGLSGVYETIFDMNGNDVGRYAIKNDDDTNWSPK